MENDRNERVTTESYFKNINEAEIQSKSYEDRVNALIDKFKALQVLPQEINKFSDNKGKTEVEETTKKEGI